MLKKREKKSFGAYIDYFLEDCEIVTKAFDVTHVHITETFVGIPEGIYGYEPKTGILTLDDEHFGVMSLQFAITGAKTGKVIFLKHKHTWDEMKQGGLVKEAEKKDVEKMAQSVMGTMKAIPATPIPIAPKPKTSGFLTKKV